MDADNLKTLITSKPFREIALLEQKHNIFSAFQYAIDENSYSRFLAYLLDSTNNHGLKTKFISRLLRQLRDIPQIPKTGFQSQAIFNWPTQEGRFIDIVVTLRDIYDNSILAAIAIENKTTSNESMDQLSDYQNAMSLFFQNIPTAIIFLTPDGRKPNTAHNSPKHKCQVLSVSYKLLANICFTDFSNVAHDVSVFLNSLGRYIETDLIEGNIMDIAKRKVLALAKNPKHKEAIETICRFAPFKRPTIRNLVYESLISQLNESGIGKVSIEWHYPQYSARPREFNFSVGDLNFKLQRPPRSIKIYYMLDACNTDEPDAGNDFTVRCMIHDSAHDASKGKSNASKNLYSKLMKLSNLPKSQSRDRQWGPWYCLFSGATYKLADLEERDTDGLSKALIDCIALTYKQLNKAISNL